MRLNWGILGLGKIAHHFCKDLALVSDARLCAVASRSEQKAIEFASQYGAQKHYADYESLLSDSDVDIIYIATPHHLHYHYAELAMMSGKHVLCEKPLTLNLAQSRKLHGIASSVGVFLMEALWSRFNPALQQVMHKVRAGEIGEVKYLHSTFSFFREFDPSSRLFNPKLAGGSILDVGIYPLFLSYIIMGVPDRISSKGILHTNGVDLQATARLDYAQGSAQIMCGLLTDCSMVSEIYGSNGRISIHDRWHETTGYTIHRDGLATDYQVEKRGKGYTHEIMHCHDCIDRGLLQSDVWSHKDSEALMAMMDTVRSQVGVIYHGESKDY